MYQNTKRCWVFVESHTITQIHAEVVLLRAADSAKIHPDKKTTVKQ